MKSNPDVEAVGWFSDSTEIADDPSVVAVAVESRNHESLALASSAVAAGKHVWLDKPAGDDLAAFSRLLDESAERGLHVQLGYMYRP